VPREKRRLHTTHLLFFLGVLGGFAPLREVLREKFIEKSHPQRRGDAENAKDAQTCTPSRGVDN